MKVEPSISKFKFLPSRYRLGLKFFKLVNFDIEAGNSISKVVYSISKQPISKQPSISKASISKKPSISGVARFQMDSAPDSET